MNQYEKVSKSVRNSGGRGMLRRLFGLTDEDKEAEKKKKQRKKMGKLSNPAHERFAQEYLYDLKAGAAYMRTYPDSSPKGAETNGPALLRRDHVKARVDELMAERERKVEIDLIDVVNTLAAAAMTSPASFYTQDAQGRKIPLRLDELSPVQKQALQDIGEDSSGQIKYILADKNKSRDMLMKHLGGYEKDNNQKSVTWEMLVKEGYRIFNLEDDEK